MNNAKHIVEIETITKTWGCLPVGSLIVADGGEIVKKITANYGVCIITGQSVKVDEREGCDYIVKLNRTSLIEIDDEEGL